MTDIAKRFSALAARLDALANIEGRNEIEKKLEKLSTVAKTIGEAWSGSWLGYQSTIYYSDFETPPSGAHFSAEWGLMERFGAESTTGDWVEMNHEGVVSHIFSTAGIPNLEDAEKLSKEVAAKFNKCRDEALSLFTIAKKKFDDEFISKLQTQLTGLITPTASQYAQVAMPKGQFMSRDSLAVTQGMRAPPHISVIARVLALKAPFGCCEDLSAICRNASSHIEVSDGQGTGIVKGGKNIFIGHGRSSAWLELRDFLEKRLKLPWDEFNRVPIAGRANVARLSEMLEEAAFAFVVLTGEDEHVDAKLHPRLNVVHEAGLFQGHLGFRKAIVLLEEECEEFSNINGLGQIRFPKGNIAACFEAIRKVLEREGILKA